MSPHDDLTDHTLGVIDRTLAGDPVPAQDARLAELTLILAGRRPHRTDAFAALLDDRVARGFAPAPDRPGQAPDGEAAPRGSQGKRGRLRPRRWLCAPGLAGAIGVVVAVAIIAIPGSGGGSSSGTGSDAAVALKAPASIAASSSTSASAAASRASAPSSAASGAAAAASQSLQFAPPNRQVIQGAQLSLSTRPARVDDVARQVFAVSSAQNGVVESSNVTATSGPGGSAQFSLTVPNQNLGPAMAALSRPRGAQAISRNDVSQDVTRRAGGAGRQLADARALRTALLRKLAVATTTTLIDSLRLQIRDANARSPATSRRCEASSGTSPTATSSSRSPRCPRRRGATGPAPVAASRCTERSTTPAECWWWQRVWP